MKLIIEIELDNAAFVDNTDELKNILENLCEKIESDNGMYQGLKSGYTIYANDTNGNRVASAQIEK